MPIALPRRAWRVLFWAQVAVVTTLMLLPQPPRALDSGWDKLNHVLAFAGPAFAGSMAWPGAASAAKRAGGLLAWGAGMELLQQQLPPRRGEWADLLADAVGIAAGALGAAAWAWAQAWVQARRALRRLGG